MKKLFPLLLTTTLLTALVACGGSAQQASTGSVSSGQAPVGPSATVYTFKLGHTGAPTHHYQTISVMFAEEVDKRTNGQVKIEIFPSDQLGNQVESIEGTMVGTQDMVLASDMALSNWVPEVGIFNLPFVFRDNAHTRTVFDGPIGEKFSKLVEPTGAVVLAWWDGGLRHITNSRRAIKTPQDLAGLKIRVPEGEVYLETFKALGATPTVVSFSELYSALQLKTVDAQENPPAHILTQKFYEVQKYVSRTGHIRSSSPLLVNKVRFEAMPKELQDTVMQVAEEMGQKHNDIVAELEKEQWEQLEKNGMEIHDPDIAPFRASVESVYVIFKSKLNAELIDEVLNAK